MFCFLAVQNVPREDSDQTAWMRRLVWIFAGHISKSSFSDVAVDKSVDQTAILYIHYENTPIPQSLFSSKNKKKNNVYTCKYQFYYIKVGFKGSTLYRYVFVMKFSTHEQWSTATAEPILNGQKKKNKKTYDI